MIDLSAGPLSYGQLVKCQQINDEETSFAFIKDPILPGAPIEENDQMTKHPSQVQHQMEEMNLQQQERQVQIQEFQTLQTRQLLEQQQKQIQQLQRQWAEQQNQQQEQQMQQQRHQLHHPDEPIAAQQNYQEPVLTPMQIPPPMALPISTSSQAVAIPDLHSTPFSPSSIMKPSLGSCVYPVQVAVQAGGAQLLCEQQHPQKPLKAEPVLSPTEMSEKIKVQLLAEQVQQNIALKKQMDHMKTQLDMQQMQMQMQMMQMQSMTSIQFGP